MKIRCIFRFFVLLGLFLKQVPLFAQSNTVLVNSSDNGPIPFLYVKCLTSGKYTMSDHNGVLKFDKNTFKETDTLTFISVFYEPVKITFDSLSKMKEIIIPYSLQELEAVTVVGLSKINIVKKVAVDFSKNHATNYIARMTRLHTIQCNEKYREFHGLYGIISSFDFNQQKPDIWFTDSNEPQVLPLTVMKSYSVTSDGNDIIHDISNLAFPDGHYRIALINKGYFVNHTALTALYCKRGIEIYSPLNIEQVDNYQYSIEEIETEDNDAILKIHFTTIPSSFPKKTRLFGEGVIYARASDYRVIKVVTENIIDYYTHHPRMMMKTPYPLATRHTLTIQYETHQQKIVDSEVILNIEWIDPGKGNLYHSIKLPSRPNPIENKLTEYEYYVFNDFRFVQKEEEQTIKSYFPEYLATGSFYDCAPFDKDVWDKIEMPGIDRTRLNNDLSGIGISLYQQATRNAFYEHSALKRFVKNNEDKALSTLKRTKQLEQLLNGN